MPHEITRTELKQYTNRAVDIINDHNSRTANNINELMSLYIKGAEIIWKDFYSDTYSHIHIPVYPFERQYCWYPIPDVINENIENGFFYGKKWISKDNYEFVFPKDNETTLLFLRNKDEMQLFSSLNKVCKDIIPIYRNSASEFEIKNKEYYINGTVESYVNLFLNLKQKNIVHIIYTAIEKSKNNINIESVYNQIDDTFFDAINLIKGLGKAHLERDVSLSIVTNQVNNITGEEDLYPQNAPVLSLVKVIEQEYPNILCKGIDIDLPINKDVLANEIFSISREYITGIRKGNCYIEESIEVQPEKTVETRIVENGVYLITGGTSGIGLALAEYISKQKKCKIILLSRSGFIDESRWNDESLDKDIKQKIGVLFRIKDNGCVLDIIRCDVADETSVKSSINYIHKKYGRIFGIIHSAGISGAGYILRKEKDSFLKVLDPKVKGALNLTSQTVDDNLDFLVLCSSAVTDSGEAGQSDYVAANSFLDAFTEYQNLKGCPTYTINWVSWKETGMAVRYGINVDTITKALTTQEAVDSFHKFLCSKPGRVLIGQYNISKELLTLYQYSRNRISDNIIKKVQSLVERQYNNALNSSSSGHEFAQIRNGTLTYIPKSDKANSVKTVTTNIVLEGDPQDDYTKTEKNVAEIYSYILGYERLNVYDNFFEMGGDSVMLTKMHDKLEEQYPGLLKVADLFDYVNIRGLSTYIDEKYSNQKNKLNEKYNIREHDKTDNEDGILYYPMSLPQQRVYYDYRVVKNKLAYNVPFVSDVSGMSKINIQHAIDTIIANNEMLRSCFKLYNKKIMRCVYPTFPVELSYITVDERPIDFSNYLTVFDISKIPLFNLTIISQGEKQWLLFDVHHILLDGYSSSLLQEEMRLVSENAEQMHEPNNYNLYVDFENQYYQSDEYKKIRDYWKIRLSDFDFQNPFVPDASYAKESYGSIQTSFPDKTTLAISTYAKRNKTTQYNIILASIFLSLYIATGKTDFIVITSVLNRHEAQFNNILGLFTNLLPLRGTINNKSTIKDFLNSVISNTKQDLKNQYYQYNHLIQDFRLKKPNFYIYLDFEDISLKRNQDVADIAVNTKIAKYDLHIDLKRRNQSLDIELNYWSHFYSKNYINKILSIFIHSAECLTSGIYDEMIIEDYASMIKSALNQDSTK